ncbi:MAG: HAMP domain-containing histidine kinase [Candidatus Kapabacteria bacterium]|nr:HAMP domain-containing histidine kinase [Candidatus Kapabacteria bacterium]
MEQNTAIEKNISEIIEAFKTLCYNFGSNFDTVCSEAISIFKKFFEIDDVAIFRKIPNTLDFHYYNLIEGRIQEYWNDKFQNLLDDGSIGMLLASCSVVSSKISDKNYKLAPLISDKDIYGILITEYDSNKIPDDLIFEDILIIISSYLSHKITNLELSNRIIELEQNMNLHIASRTINLVKNNQQLADKIRGLYKNLSMALPHEFRTPLNQILGNSDFLMKHFDVTDPKEAKDIISDIYVSCRRLQTLIEHYLVLSQLELIAINIEQLDEIRSARTPSVETSIYNVLSSKSDYEMRYEDFKIELEDASIQMSENFFTILMTELIDNAVKYSDNGKPIIIKTKADSENLNLMVMDYGMGINQEDLNKIDAYTQFDRDKFEQQGLGLGLAIVHRIVDISGSKIKIESEVNNFTKVEISIPLANN